MEAEPDRSNLCRKENKLSDTYLPKLLVHQVLLPYIIQYSISHGPDIQIKYSILVFYVGFLFSSIILLKHSINYTFKETI